MGFGIRKQSTSVKISGDEQFDNPKLPDWKRFPIQTNMPYVVVDEEVYHIGKLMGHIHNGGGILPIGKHRGIKVVRNGSDYVKLQVLQYGIQHNASEQTWQRTKTKVEKREVIKYKKPEKPQKETLQVDTQVTDSEDLF